MSTKIDVPLEGEEGGLVFLTNDKEIIFKDNFDAITHEMRKIMLGKRKLRGTTNIQNQGLPGVVARIAQDKMSRIEREVNDVELRAKMAERGVPTDVIDKYVPEADHNESLEDDLMDVANYCIIAILLLRGEWE